MAASGQTIVSGAIFHQVGGNTSQGEAYVYGLIDATSTGIACTPTRALSGSPATCTATVADAEAGPQGTPGGTVSFSSSSTAGAFDGPAQCTLAATTATTASCSVAFTPTASGNYTLSADYGGDGLHQSSVGSGTFASVDPTCHQRLVLPAAKGRQ